MAEENRLAFITKLHMDTDAKRLDPAGTLLHLLDEFA
jgi:hypothetical protein